MAILLVFTSSVWFRNLALVTRPVKALVTPAIRIVIKLLLSFEF